MSKSSESVLAAGGVVEESNANELIHNPEISRPPSIRMEGYSSTTIYQGEEKDVPKFTMIFNKYSDKMNLRPIWKNQEDNNHEKYGSKYAMIFNKDVTIRQKTDSSKTNVSEQNSKTDVAKGFKTVLEQELDSMKLNDTETLMNLCERSNLFTPELTVCSMLSESEESCKNMSELRGSNDTWLDNTFNLHNSLTFSKNLTNQKTQNFLKNKIASMTSLETHLAKETPRKHVSGLQERKLFRVRSLDLSESVSSSDSDLDRTFNFQKPSTEAEQFGKESKGESLRKSDKKSRGDSARKTDKESGYRKQVQWKSEVDVIYFESHQAADGDRAGEILGRVMEPLREEWEQQRTGFYAKMIPLPLGNNFNERWQSLLKI